MHLRCLLLDCDKKEANAHTDTDTGGHGSPLFAISVAHRGGHRSPLFVVAVAAVAITMVWSGWW